MSTEPLRTVRDRLSEFVERVHREHERVTITRNGSPAAVLISPEDLESLEEPSSSPTAQACESSEAPRRR